MVDLAVRHRAHENAVRTWRLAEKAQGQLEGREPREPPKTDREWRQQMRENTERTRRLAEKAQAELDKPKQADA